MTQEFIQKLLSVGGACAILAWVLYPRAKKSDVCRVAAHIMGFIAIALVGTGLLADVIGLLLK